MYGLLGRELGKPKRDQPVGEDHDQWMKVTALQTEGIPIGFTTYRRPDITGRFPEWYQTFTRNYGDVDQPPIGIPLGPRHFSINARVPFSMGE